MLAIATQSSRPDEVGSDQIKTLIENNQPYTTCEISTQNIQITSYW